MYFSCEENGFNYPVTRVFEVNDRVQKSVNSGEWDYDVHKYADNMTMVASLFIDGEAVIEGVYTVVALAGGECRGVGVYVNGLLYMTMHGMLADAEEISFKAVNNVTGNVLDVEETIVFNGAHYGSGQEPYRLNVLNTEGVGSAAYPAFAIYPNPVRSVMYISGENVHMIESIKVLTTDGEIVLSNDGYDGDGVEMVSVAQGVYVVAISTADGVYHYKKIIKL